MLINKHDIINSTIRRLGNSAILSNDLNDQIEQSYQFGIKLLLSSYCWNFNQCIAQLLLDTDITNNTQFSYKFVLPANLQKIIGIFDQKIDKSLQQYQYQLINNNIYINCKNAFIQYVSNDFIDRNVPAYFADYLINWLVIELIYIIGDKTNLNFYLKNLDDSMNRAKSIDSNNNGLETYASMSTSFLARFNSSND